LNFSVVIPSGSFVNLGHCIAELRSKEPDLPPERIVIVDDSDGDDSRTQTACSHFGFRYIGGEKPFIFSRACNAGFRKAFEWGAKQAILLADDALLRTRNGFTMLSQAAERSPMYGLLAPATNNVGNENQFSHDAMEIRKERKRLCFISVLLPRIVWDQVGPMDEDFTGYGYDDDAYSLMVRRAGYALGVYDPCFVEHSHLPSVFRPVNNYPHAEMAHNRQIFEKKYGGLQ
jgi:GT2 family glycosyltransferase